MAEQQHQPQRATWVAPVAQQRTVVGKTHFRSTNLDDRAGVLPRGNHVAVKRVTGILELQAMHMMDMIWLEKNRLGGTGSWWTFLSGYISFGLHLPQWTI